MPFHVAAVATTSKSFRDNPVIGSAWLNGKGLHIGRMMAAARLTAWRRKRLAHLVTTEDTAALARDGFILKRNFLPDAFFHAIQRELLELCAPARDMMQGDTVTRRIALDQRRRQELPETRRLLESAEWLGLLRYVGASALEPLTYVQSIFSHARKGPTDPQTRFHADTFHSSVKAWLFLEDVPEDGSPFVYVAGSHRLTPRRLAWEKQASIVASQSNDFEASRGSLRVSIEQLRALGYAEPRRFAVPANTLIVAETLGFHARDRSSHPTVRVELWAYGRRNPFLPWVGLDPVGLPLVKGRAIPLSWSTADFAEYLRLSRNSWRKAGIVRVTAAPNIDIHRP
jgi:hypothetical protein